MCFSSDVRDVIELLEADDDAGETVDPYRCPICEQRDRRGLEAYADCYTSRVQVAG